MPFAYFVKDTEHLARNVTFQTTDHFRFSLSLFCAPLKICLGPIVVTESDNYYSIKSGVRLAVATTIETVTIGFA